MSAARTLSRANVAPRSHYAVRLLLHFVALGVAYDAVRGVVRLAARVVTRVRRRLHAVAPAPGSIYESLGVRR
jgi:hypothetical protein